MTAATRKALEGSCYYVGYADGYYGRPARYTEINYHEGHSDGIFEREVDNVLKEVSRTMKGGSNE